MKAWIVRDINRDEPSMGVVFAETRGKAKKIAMNIDPCEDALFTQIQCKRFPEADVMYKDGMKELDWCDDEARVFLVKNGWSCFDPDAERCEECPAKVWCSQWGDED